MAGWGLDFEITMRVKVLNVLVRLGGAEEAIEAYRQLRERMPGRTPGGDAAVDVFVGSMLELLGHTEEAVARYRSSLECGESAEAYFALIPALRRMGDRVGAEEAMDAWVAMALSSFQQLERQGQLGSVGVALVRRYGPEEARRILAEKFPEATESQVAVCLLGMANSAAIHRRDAESAEELAREAVRLDPANEQVLRTEYLLLDTQGDLPARLEIIRARVESAVDDASRALCLDLLQQALGEAGQYEEALQRVLEARERYPWLVAERALAMRKREVALARSIDDVLARGEIPEDRDSLLELAGVCHCTGRHAAAARLYRRAFEGGLLPGERISPFIAFGHRCHALRSAARAGSAPDLDDAGLSLAERAVLRRQALDLARDLLERHRLEVFSNVNGQTALMWYLFRLRVDPAFAGVRDEAALAALPPDEAEAWRAFWAEADELWQLYR